MITPEKVARLSFFSSSLLCGGDLQNQPKTQHKQLFFFRSVFNFFLLPVSFRSVINSFSFWWLFLRSTDGGVLGGSPGIAAAEEGIVDLPPIEGEDDCCPDAGSIRPSLLWKETEGGAAVAEEIAYRSVAWWRWGNDSVLAEEAQLLAG